MSWIWKSGSNVWSQSRRGGAFPAEEQQVRGQEGVEVHACLRNDWSVGCGMK